MRASRRPIFAINPMAVARAESDHVDARTLADILCVDAHLHRRAARPQRTRPGRRVLACAQQDAVWRRARTVNELRALPRDLPSAARADYAAGQR
ncbi:hypothetical protein IU474_14865 [Nocardia otitidiscaviarum]|nr:hypothetical protein [Nocardia otitidiscaviarum]